jgi:DNA-binding IclR family transcriptional regulator
MSATSHVNPPVPLFRSPQLLERTCLLLSMFTPERQDWTVTELGRACDLAVPTAHRIVSALYRNGFLERDEVTKKYRLGPAILRLGRVAAMAVDLQSVSRPILRRLATRTRETALLTVVAEGGLTSTCLDRVESAEPLRLSVQPGYQVPLHAGASQKALLAYRPEHEIERVLNENLPALCSATIVAPDRLRAELAMIRKRGWVSSFEETNKGVWGLAVALLDEHGHSVAALGVAGPCDRKPKALGPWLSLLAECAGKIASGLGLSPSLVPIPAQPGPARPPVSPRPSSPQNLPNAASRRPTSKEQGK